MKDIFEKKYQQQHYTPSKDKQNVFYTHRDENVQDVDWSTHSCEEKAEAQNKAIHSMATKIYFSNTDFIFMQFE